MDKQRKPLAATKKAKPKKKAGKKPMPGYLRRDMRAHE